MTDLQTGLYAHGAIMAALYAREKSGKGQRIDVSLLETQVASLVNMGSSYLLAGKEGKRYGTEHQAIVPYRLFRTKATSAEEENGIVIGCGNNRHFEILSGILSHPEWAHDEEMKTNELRVKNREKVNKLIQDELLKETSSYWMEKFRNSGIPVGPLQNLKQTFTHPQVIHRNMITEVQHEKIGPIKLVGIPVKYSLNKPAIQKAPPLLGEDTDAILSRILKLTEKEIADLKSERVV